MKNLNKLLEKAEKEGKRDLFWTVIANLEKYLTENTADKVMDYFHLKAKDMSDAPCGDQDHHGDTLEFLSNYIGLSEDVIHALREDVKEAYTEA